MLFFSWMPTGYLFAWLINLILFFVELIAWMINGPFYVYWATVSTWAGLFLACGPVAFEFVYILSEYPFRNNTTPWPFTFYSGEFFLLFG